MGKQVTVFEGVNSDLHFGIIPLRNDAGIFTFHFCWGYSNQEGKRFDKVPLIDFWSFKALAF